MITINMSVKICIFRGKILDMLLIQGTHFDFQCTHYLRPRSIPAIMLEMVQELV